MTGGKTTTFTKDNDAESNNQGKTMEVAGKEDALGALMKGPKTNCKFFKEIGKIRGGPEDVTPMISAIGQVKTMCAAGNWCKVTKEADANYGHRCMVCGFCAHQDCDVAVGATNKRKPNKRVDRVCYGCLHVIGLENKVQKLSSGGEVISLRHAKLQAYLRDEYPRLVLLNKADVMAEDSDEDDEDDDAAKEEESKAGQEANNEVDALIKNGEHTHQVIEERIKELQLQEDETAAEWKAVKAKLKNPYKKNFEVPEASDDDGEESTKGYQEGEMLTQDMEQDGKPNAEEQNEDEAADGLYADSEDEATIHMTDDGASEATKERGSKEKSHKASTNKASKPMANVTTKKFLDLQIMGIKPTDTTPGAAVQAAIMTCKKWMEGMHSVVPSFKLHKTEEDGHQTILHDLQHFPKDMEELKSFFKGMRPSFEPQRLYLKVHAEWQGTEASLLSNTTWYHKQRNESIRVASIQAANVETVGWMLYSTRFMDANFWGDAWSKLCNRTVAARWKRINDGTKFDAKRDMSKDPRAIHIECAQQDKEKVAATFGKYYSSKATHFPYGTKMRIVPLFQRLTDSTAKRKFAKLLNRQNGWCKQVLTTTMEGIAIDIDNPKDLAFGGGKTLREILMKWKHEDGKKKITPLFNSIDLAWHKRGYVFQYHPSKENIAQAMIKGMISRLSSQYPNVTQEAMYSHFKPEAILENAQMIWDPENKIMKSKADEAICDIFGVDSDMEFEGDQEEDEQEQVKVIYQRERTQDDDSVSTFRSKQTKRKADPEGTPTKKQKVQETGTPQSDLSSLTAGTKDTFMARMKSLEEVVMNLAGRIEIASQLPTSATVTPNGERNHGSAEVSQPSRNSSRQSRPQDNLKAAPGL